METPVRGVPRGDEGIEGVEGSVVDQMVAPEQEHRRGARLPGVGQRGPEVPCGDWEGGSHQRKVGDARS